MSSLTDALDKAKVIEAAEDANQAEIARAAQEMEAALNAAKADDAADEATIAALNAEIDRLEDLLDEEPPPPVDPPPDPEDGLNVETALFGAATTNDPVKHAALQASWGPIRMAREYDGGKGILPVTEYSWFDFVSKNYTYLTFSADEQKSVASYTDIANGKHDTKWKALIDSLKTKLPMVQGVICVGNEPNTELKPATDGPAYRAAVEHLIDKFGYQPAPGWMWGVAFSNYNVWGPGSKAVGAQWLPRRDEGPFMVETHFYGRSGYGDPQNHLGLLMAEMKKHAAWYWGVGEISAQEDPTHTKKGQWFLDVADYIEKNNGKAMLMFDTNVGGSADIATSENTRRAVATIAGQWSRKGWDLVP